MIWLLTCLTLKTMSSINGFYIVRVPKEILKINFLVNSLFWRDGFAPFCAPSIETLESAAVPVERKSSL
jgi:hypothetical protein